MLMPNANVIFGEFAREKREEAKLSQNQVALTLGYSKNSRTVMYRLERGDAVWGINHMIGLAELYELNLDELIKQFLNFGFGRDTDQKE
jgi:transcriptional regulator with XRE-family HTH domain